MIKAITSIVMATAGAVLLLLGVFGLLGSPITALGKYTPDGRDFGLQVLLAILGASLLAWAIMHYKLGKK
jgi:cytochrome c biogenesis protein CcdA